MNYEKMRREVERQIQTLETEIYLAQEKKMQLEKQLDKLKLEETGIQKTLLFG